MLQQTIFVEFCQSIPTPFYTNHALQMGRLLMHQHRENLLLLTKMMHIGPFQPLNHDHIPFDLRHQLFQIVYDHVQMYLSYLPSNLGDESVVFFYRSRLRMVTCNHHENQNYLLAVTLHCHHVER